MSPIKGGELILQLRVCNKYAETGSVFILQSCFEQAAVMAAARGFPTSETFTRPGPARVPPHSFHASSTTYRVDFADNPPASPWRLSVKIRVAKNDIRLAVEGRSTKSFMATECVTVDANEGHNISVCHELSLDLSTFLWRSCST